MLCKLCITEQHHTTLHAVFYVCAVLVLAAVNPSFSLRIFASISVCIKYTKCFKIFQMKHLSLVLLRKVFLFSDYQNDPHWQSCWHQCEASRLSEEFPLSEEFRSAACWLLSPDI